MIVSFTGSRGGMTDAQRVTVARLLAAVYADSGELTTALPEQQEFHHGACVGSDEQALAIARSVGYEIHAHAADDVPIRLITRASSDVNHVMLPALVRNAVLAEVCELLVATPASDTEVRRSGTWATIRRALKVGRLVWVVLPSGQVRAVSS